MSFLLIDKTGFMKTLLHSGVVFILIGVVGYSCFPILVKWIQESGIQPLDIAIWRFTLAFPVIWALIFALRLPPPDEPLPRRGLILLGALLAMGALTAFIGLQYLPAGIFTLLFFSHPAMIVVINLLRGERLPLQTWLALGLVLLGIVLIVPQDDVSAGNQAALGVLLAFVNALLIALYFLLNNHLVRGNQAARRASAWTLTGTFISVWLLALLRGVSPPPDLRTWLLLIVLATFSTVMPVFLFTLAIERLGASRAAIFSTIEPVGTAVLGAVLLGERMGAIQVLGGALIVVSLVLLQVRRSRRRIPAIEAADART